MAGEGAKGLDAKVICRYCEKEVDIEDLKNHWKPLFESPGNHIGDPYELGKNIRKGVGITKHPLYLKDWLDPKDNTMKNKEPQAHHLISSAAMKKSVFWKKTCRDTGYDINCCENGVYLPSNMSLACHLGIPVHRSNHSAGYGEYDDEPMSYPNAVKKRLEEAKAAIENFECNHQTGDKIIKELNTTSEEIFDHVKGFDWTITYDGFDYKDTSDIGCAGCSTFDDKKEALKTQYKRKVDHDHRKPGDEGKFKEDVEAYKVIKGLCNRKHFPGKKYDLEISK